VTCSGSNSIEEFNDGYGEDVRFNDEVFPNDEELFVQNNHETEFEEFEDAEERPLNQEIQIVYNSNKEFLEEEDKEETKEVNISLRKELKNIKIVDYKSPKKKKTLYGNKVKPS